MFIFENSNLLVSVETNLLIWCQSELGLLSQVVFVWCKVHSWAARDLFLNVTIGEVDIAVISQTSPNHSWCFKSWTLRLHKLRVRVSDGRTCLRVSDYQLLIILNLTFLLFILLILSQLV